jgi:hypothetical protein
LLTDSRDATQQRLLGRGPALQVAVGATSALASGGLPGICQIWQDFCGTE